jgi:hypothetical protein
MTHFCIHLQSVHGLMPYLLQMLFYFACECRKITKISSPEFCVYTQSKHIEQEAMGSTYLISVCTHCHKVLCL